MLQVPSRYNIKCRTIGGRSAKVMFLNQSKGPQLKVIATMSVGYDHIDVEAVRSRNILLGYTPDVLTDATADLTVLLTLAAARRLKEV